MSHQHPHGMTLTELLVVIGVLTMVLLAIVGLVSQSGQLYRRTMPRLTSLSAQQLAIKRMQREMREAMFIDISPSTATWMEIVLPTKDPATGFNMIVENSETHALGLQQGQTVRYFLGVREFPDAADRQHWLAVPNPEGDTLFRVDDSMTPVNGRYANAPVIITDIRPPQDEHGGSTGLLFSYWAPTDTQGSADESAGTPTDETQLVQITLQSPIRLDKPRADSTPLTTWTQFHLRNLESSQRR